VDTLVFQSPVAGCQSDVPLTINDFSAGKVFVFAGCGRLMIED
jgi:hypothetical protein